MGEVKVSRAVLPAMMLLAVAGSLSACSLFDRSSPDEFQVVARAPLEVPPDYSLRPPQPGSPRPQELDREARNAGSVFGAAGGGSGGLIDPRVSRQQSNGEGALLALVGADQANPDIRAIVDRENPGVVVGDRNFLDKMMFWKGEQQPDIVTQPGSRDDTVSPSAPRSKVAIPEPGSGGAPGESRGVRIPLGN